MRPTLILAAGAMLVGPCDSAIAQAPPIVVACDPAALSGSELLGIALFDEDGASLGRSQRDALLALMQSAKASGFARLLVVGHTDEAGSAEDNLALGRRRALAAATLLAPAAGALALAPMTCGETLPVISVSGRRHPHNRRVELRGLR